MAKKRIQKKNKLKLSIQKAAERSADREDGKQKNIIDMAEIKKARKKPLSALSNIILREEQQSRTGAKSYTEFVVSKAQQSGTITIPANSSDISEIRKITTSPKFKPVSACDPKYEKFN